MIHKMRNQEIQPKDPQICTNVSHFIAVFDAQYMKLNISHNQHTNHMNVFELTGYYCTVQKKHMSDRQKGSTLRLLVGWTFYS